MELARLTIAFLLLFVAVPGAVAGSATEGSWGYRAAAGFVRVSLFFRIAIMFTGLLGSMFPGIIAALWVTWAVAAFVHSHRDSAFSVRERFDTAILRVFQMLERQSGIGWRPRWSQISWIAVCFSVLAGATLLQRAWFPLHNLRFSNISSYSHALSLQMFLHRDLPTAGGAELLLAPLAVFSGLYADSVIRFSGALFSAALVLATGLCAHRLTGNASAALIASGLMSIWPVIAGSQHPGEFSPSEIAAVYLLLGMAFFRKSPWLVLYAVSVALLVSWRPSPVLVVACVCVGVSLGVSKALSLIDTQVRWVPAGAVAAVAVMVLMVNGNSDTTDGPFEYESAARACRAIAAKYPRNEWLIISPVHELPFTYGRGWHFELLDFVSGFSPGQITKQDFVFPYNVRDIFVFVEKEPLRPAGAGNTGSLDLTQTMDPAVLAYNTGVGRASIEFKAGALLTAYAANHSDISVFHEDERLVVFHVKGHSVPPAVDRVEHVGPESGS